MKNGLEVFDFKEEDELPEIAGGKFLTKFKNPSIDDPALSKYKFLECVAQGSDVPRKEIDNLPRIDVDTIECDNSCNNPTTYATLRMAKEENPCSDSGGQLNSHSHEQNSCSKIDNYESKSFFAEHEAGVSCNLASSPVNSQLNCAISDSPSSSEPVDVKSNADESVTQSSSLSSPTSDMADDGVSLNGHASDNSFRGSERDKINVAVDYVVYQDNYYTRCLVTFSEIGIKINGSTTCGDQATFSVERGIDDIIHIEPQHLQRVETVTVKLHIVSKDVLKTAHTCGASGTEELEFVVVEPEWSLKWEEITSLNVKYLALWRNVSDMDVTMDGGTGLLQQRPYFPNFDEAFEDVVYPKGDSDAVSISKRDVDLLQPETFINDTIIDFYIKYLKNQIPPEEKRRFHFFNSFFFRKLADLDKDPSSASDGRAAFLRVHKWTRKVDLFGKDYIFIPVNFNLHWSLLVICHPGDVASFEDEGPGKLLRVPCILHMDSIKGTHAGLKNLVQSYLWEEWKARQKETAEDLSSKFLNLRFVSLELPQQENTFDCGLFLLHYLELFLIEAPVNFSPFKVNKFSKFLNTGWFAPAEASLKRTLIQRLISELLENRSPELSSHDCSDELQSNVPKNNGKETGVEFVSGRCTSRVGSHGNLSIPEACQGIEITLLDASSLRNSQCVNDPGLVLREFLEPEVAAGSLLAQFSSFDQPSSFYRLNGAMSQMEVDAETGEPYAYFPCGQAAFQQIDGITPQAGSIAYSFRGFGVDASWNPEISMPGDDNDSSSEPSTCDSDDSDVGIIENCPVKDGAVECQKEEIDQQISPAMENVDCSTESHVSRSNEMLDAFAIEDTKDPDKMHDGNENGNHTHVQENPTTTLLEDSPNTVENGLHLNLEKVEIIGNDLQATGDDAFTESDERRATKRLRVTPPSEGDREEVLDGNLSNDLHL